MWPLYPRLLLIAFIIASVVRNVRCQNWILGRPEMEQMEVGGQKWKLKIQQIRIQNWSRRFGRALTSLFLWTTLSLALRYNTISYHPARFAPTSLTCQRTNRMPYAAKAKTQQFTRRKSNLVKKSHQLARLCHADLALIIRKDGRYYTYRSTNHDQWPPTITEIVCMNLAHTTQALTGL